MGVTFLRKIRVAWQIALMQGAPVGVAAMLCGEAPAGGSTSKTLACLDCRRGRVAGGDGTLHHTVGERRERRDNGNQHHQHHGARYVRPAPIVYAPALWRGTGGSWGRLPRTCRGRRRSHHGCHGRLRGNSPRHDGPRRRRRGEMPRSQLRQCGAGWAPIAPVLAPNHRIGRNSALANPLQQHLAIGRTIGSAAAGGHHVPHEVRGFGNGVGCHGGRSRRRRIGRGSIGRRLSKLRLHCRSGARSRRGWRRGGRRGRGQRLCRGHLGRRGCRGRWQPGRRHCALVLLGRRRAVGPGRLWGWPRCRLWSRRPAHAEHFGGSRRRGIEIGLGKQCAGNRLHRRLRKRAGRRGTGRRLPRRRRLTLRRNVDPGVALRAKAPLAGQMRLHIDALAAFGTKELDAHWNALPRESARFASNNYQYNPRRRWGKLMPGFELRTGDGQSTAARPVVRNLWVVAAARGASIHRRSWTHLRSIDKMRLLLDRCPAAHLPARPV